MDPNTPAWALSAAAAIAVLVAALVAAGYSLARFGSFLGDKWLAWRKKKREADREEATADERSSTAEAWDVVDRLTKELEAVGPRVEALERKCDTAEQRAIRCEAEHEGTKQVLRLVVAWGKQHGMKLPQALEAEIGQRRSPGGSDTHRAHGTPGEEP
jgi:hypothetical protein